MEFTNFTKIFRCLQVILYLVLLSLLTLMFPHVILFLTFFQKIIGLSVHSSKYSLCSLCDFQNAAVVAIDIEGEWNHERREELKKLRIAIFNSSGIRSFIFSRIFEYSRHLSSKTSREYEIWTAPILYNPKLFSISKVKFTQHYPKHFVYQNFSMMIVMFKFLGPETCLCQELETISSESLVTIEVVWWRN